MSFATRLLPSAAAGPLVAEARGLVRAYGQRVVLAALDLRIHRAEIVALLGPSGCGKTTLLRTLAGLDTVQGGEITVSAKVSTVFQEPRLLPWKRVIDNVMLLDRANRDKGQALQMLDEVGLAGHADAWPVTLSGGEAQRAALARALLTQPELLLLDEPFAALDALSRLRMHALVRDLIRRYAPGTLLVTHDVDEAIALADRILVMKHGRIADEFVLAGGEKTGEASAAARLRSSLLETLGVFG